MEDVLNCKRCGGKILVTGYCSQCGLKSEYVNKALNTSKFYYNVGLDKARVRDMSGAEEALKTSLRYDRMNIDARNLLGLIYYETGEIVLALSHWVISVNYFSGRNVAKRYIKEVKSSPHKLEITNNVARKYNQALAYAKQGSKDLAFIQIRKVLSDNPKFVKGYLLLALLFIDEGKYDKAQKALKRVIKIDRTNPLAIRYFNEMGHSDEEIMNFRDYPEDDYDADLLFVEDQPKVYSGPETVVTNDEGIPVGKYKDINFYKYSIAYVVVGIILGLAVMWFLILPQREKNTADDNRDLKLAFSEEIANKNVSISSLENEVDNLTTQVDSLTTQVEQYEAAESQKISDVETVKMQEAVKLYEAQDYEGALDSIAELLDTAPSYDGALYYQGLCYLALEKEEDAEDSFNLLISNCADSVYLEAAKSYVTGDGTTDDEDRTDDTDEPGDGTDDTAEPDDTTSEDDMTHNE